MKRLDLGVALIGLFLMGLALTAVDWRLGLFFAGFGLAASVIELPRSRA